MQDPLAPFTADPPIGFDVDPDGTFYRLIATDDGVERSTAPGDTGELRPAASVTPSLQEVDFVADSGTVGYTVIGKLAAPESLLIWGNVGAESGLRRYMLLPP